jgi:STE24 endopeptidase
MNLYLVIILLILIGTYLLNLIEDLLNIRYARTDLPSEFEGHYEADTYKKSQEYLRENTRFEMVTDTLFTPLLVAFILAGGFDVVDRFARGFQFGSIATGLIFSGILIFSYHLLHIPFTIYDTFVIEEKYGFNKTTPKTFALDLLKIWLLAAIIGSILLAAVLLFFEKTGHMAWLYCWIAVSMFQVFLAFIAPVVIMPLFNKFVPLAESKLKEAIEDYAGSQGFKMKGVFVMDGSKRSTKSNAYLSGFGRFRRIVLFDTLVDNHTVEELVSVLAHEMGHYKKGHILKSIIFSVLTTGLMFYILSLFINNREIFTAFKMGETSVYASLFFFGFLYTPLGMILSILTNFLSRKNEYEADAFAVRTYGKPESFIRALKKLTVTNLSNLTPHPLKVFLSYSHPPVLERIRAIRSIPI